jgi:hypothetical protein
VGEVGERGVCRRVEQHVPCLRRHALHAALDVRTAGNDERGLGGHGMGTTCGAGSGRLAFYTGRRHAVVPMVEQIPLRYSRWSERQMPM